MAGKHPVGPWPLALGFVALGGCASVPSGPSVAVMPAPGQSFESFVADDRICRTYAAQSVGASVNQTGAANLVGSAAVGTALGAAAGAALGGNEGARAGAGSGLIAGTVVGTGLAAGSQASIQRRYDIAYEQCMYAKGNQLPMATSSGHRGSAVVAPYGMSAYPPSPYPPPPP